jgi:hypothetical protein
MSDAVPILTLAKAKLLVREHWESMGFDPDEMASFDDLSESEQERWLARVGEQR